jgi:hypothetical protein
VQIEVDTALAQYARSQTDGPALGSECLERGRCSVAKKLPLYLNRRQSGFARLGEQCQRATTSSKTSSLHWAY